MRPVTIIIAVILAGCRQASVPGPAPEAPQAPLPDLASVTNLAGEWRVAGIDGEPFDERYGLALSGSGEELWWEPRCAGAARSYRVEGKTITFGPSSAQGTPPRPDEPLQPVCAVAIPSKLPVVLGALDAATHIGRTAENGVLISGGGRTLLLFSQ